MTYIKRILIIFKVLKNVFIALYVNLSKLPNKTPLRRQQIQF